MIYCLSFKGFRQMLIKFKYKCEVPQFWIEKTYLTWMIVDIVQHQTKLYHMKGPPGKPQISPTDNSSIHPASSDAFNMDFLTGINYFQNTKQLQLVLARLGFTRPGESHFL